MKAALKIALCAAAFLAALLIGHQNARASVASMIRVAPGVEVLQSTETGFAGYAFVGEPRLWLSPMAYREASRGDGVGMLIFLHEYAHTTGIVVEREANCYALDHMRPVLRRFYGFTKRHAQRSYRDALSYQRYQPEVYRCAT
jgi:hypothetical protein